MRSVALVDTSVWVQGFRGEPSVRDPLDRLLDRGIVYLHPWSRYELDLGGISQVQADALAGLPSVERVADEEVWTFVLRNGLKHSGVGWVDAAILAAAQRAGIAVWTLDDALARAARRIALPPVRHPR